ncbi:MAG: hypothetical protein JW973_15475 [Bacteroidales bacterium]|nr:hypothetical protein [Bacteroidales bacterium]
MNRTPSYYRARIEVIRELISTVEVDRLEKGNDIILLRNGIFQESFKEEELIRKKLAEKTFSNDALIFSELTRFNTWFAMHPEKVCGKEIVTTSIEFPITIKGSREDIMNTIHIESDPEQLELQALAIEVELQLLQL